MNISTLAIVMALSNQQVPCTILGMKNVQEVRIAAKAANRYQRYQGPSSWEDQLRHVLSPMELKAWEAISHPETGPFAKLWKSTHPGPRLYEWDGIQGVREFWNPLVDSDNQFCVVSGGGDKESAKTTIKIEHWQATVM